MKHWLGIADYQPGELADLVALARRLKAGKARANATLLRDRILTMVFFNPSLRTRTSFEAAMLRYGGHSICLNVGGDTWNLEHRLGVVMDGACSEHIKEAAAVLSRYGDALAVRTFAGLIDADDDAADRVIRGFAEYATVPVLNMESAVEHPCQGLADWMTMDEKLGGTKGRRFVLSWAPHVKALPMAVPQSAVLCAAAAGMNVTIAHPRGYDLNPVVLKHAATWCADADMEFQVTHDQSAACRDADALYVKSWGSTEFYGNAAAQRTDFQRYADWMIDKEHLGTNAFLMHCLPVRRNLVISDAALDDKRSVVVDQAENRMWTQAAILSRTLGP